MSFKEVALEAGELGTMAFVKLCTEHSFSERSFSEHSFSEHITAKQTCTEHSCTESPSASNV